VQPCATCGPREGRVDSFQAETSAVCVNLTFWSYAAGHGQRGTACLHVQGANGGFTPESVSERVVPWSYLL